MEQGPTKLPIITFHDLAAAINQMSEREKYQPLRIYEANDNEEVFTVEAQLENDDKGRPFLDLHYTRAEVYSR